LPNSKKTPGRKQPRKNASETPAEGRQSGDWSSVLALLREQKEKAIADRVEIQIQIIAGNLVPRNLVVHTIGNISSTYRVQFLGLDLSLSDMLCAVLGIHKMESGEVRKILSDAAYGVMKEQQKKLIDFIETA